MTIETSIKMSEEAKAIPQDKFDNHMKRARENDIDSRKKAFVRQTEASVERENRINGLKPSVY